MYRRMFSVTLVTVGVQVERARVSSLVSVYEVDVSGGQYPSSSSSLAAVAVYNATDVEQVSVSANHISLQLPQSISTGSGAYSVLLQTGNDLPFHWAHFTVLKIFFWSSYGIGQTIIVLPCGFFFFLSFFLSFSSPNLSHRRLDVCRTSTHGVALVRI